MLFLMSIFLASAGCLDSIKDELISCENKVGECRYEILQSGKYSKLHIEINYVSGYEPSSDALDLLRQRINEVTDKNTVTISQNSFGSTDTSYSLEEILEIENSQRNKFKGTLYSEHFKKPHFHIVVLFIDKKESVKRQGLRYLLLVTFC